MLSDGFIAGIQRAITNARQNGMNCVCLLHAHITRLIDEITELRATLHDAHWRIGALRNTISQARNRLTTEQVAHLATIHKLEAAQAEGVRLAAENAALRGQLDGSTHFICAYCGEIVPREQMQAHVETCDKHPMAALKRENEQLRNILNNEWQYACGHCGTPFANRDEILYHLGTCEDNPLVKENDALRADAENWRKLWSSLPYARCTMEKWMHESRIFSVSIEPGQHMNHRSIKFNFNHPGEK